MRPKLVFPEIISILLVCCSAVAEESKAPAEDSAVKSLVKESSALRRKAMDQRVMSLNALKNADAARGEAHAALVEAMTEGKSESISKARDDLNDAADELEAAIEDANRVIEYALKAEMSARQAEEMCSGSGEKNDIDLNKVKSLLESSGKQVSKAEEIAAKLRKVWLEPFLASTTTTSSTTSTTKAATLPPAK